MLGTVVVTGAERGLGLCLTRAFLAAGAAVVAGKRASDRNLRALGEHGGKLTIVQMDVGDPASVRAAAVWVAARFEAIDLLVNNAGVHPGYKGGARVPPEEAAAGIFRLAVEPGAAGNGSFVDHRGEPLPW